MTLAYFKYNCVSTLQTGVNERNEQVGDWLVSNKLTFNYNNTKNILNQCCHFWCFDREIWCWQLL